MVAIISHFSRFHAPNSKNDSLLFRHVTKGQTILKGLLDIFNFSHRTNENKSTWGIIVVKLNFFVRFFLRIEDTKKYFSNYPTFKVGIELESIDPKVPKKVIHILTIHYSYRSKCV